MPLVQHPNGWCFADGFWAPDFNQLGQMLRAGGYVGLRFELRDAGSDEVNGEYRLAGDKWEKRNPLE
jgi:hypothetical protein